MPASTTHNELRRALGDVSFPADKDRLVDQALANGTDEQTVRALRAIPPVEYRSLSEVLSSVALRDEQDIMSPGQRAQAQRTHTKAGLAQSAKDIPPINPIVEELGTNRGS
ncbi:MAG: DUF2795 domain-containing protein [Pseudonocardiaceae bacterium]